jgi:hypothetical protein
MTCACSTTACVTYVVGTKITAIQPFTLNGAPYTPSSAFAWAHPPVGAATLITATLVVGTTATYQASFTPTAPGPWIARFADSATPPATGSFVADQRFSVGPLLY